MVELGRPGRGLLGRGQLETDFINRIITTAISRPAYGEFYPCGLRLRTERGELCEWREAVALLPLPHFKFETVNVMLGLSPPS